MTVKPKKTALLIAFHFPPLQGSSGLQRSLGFARHLPQYGWQPVVLAPHTRAYSQVDIGQLALIPPEVEVRRAFCLDSARHLSIFGRYPDSLGIPDRWISWIPGALLTGMRTIQKHRPSVIWSTYPIATSLIIGRILSRWAGIPLIADFRDPMVERNSRTGNYAPPDPRLRKARLRVEKATAAEAAALVFCTESARDICVERYDELDPARCHVITNGFEEAYFTEIEKNIASKRSDSTSRPFTLVHSGTIYPTPDRDPGPFFDTISELKNSGDISAANLRVILRATGHDEIFRPMLVERAIDDIVLLEPSLPYAEALTEMMHADGLLLFQGYTSNPAIPAKLYEYLRAGTPILALIDAAGSTARLLDQLDTGIQASIEEPEAIEHALKKFIAIVKSDEYRSPPRESITRYSRSALSREMAGLFESIID